MRSDPCIGRASPELRTGWSGMLIDDCKTRVLTWNSSFRCGGSAGHTTAAGAKHLPFEARAGIQDGPNGAQDNARYRDIRPEPAERHMPASGEPCFIQT